MKKLLLIIPALISGAVLFLGALFKVMHWPGAFYLRITGVGGVIASLIVFVLIARKVK